MKIVVIGGGAAGFFAALSCKMHHPDYDVCILEQSDKLLAKVKVSGGGRCNLTHACFENSQLAKFYPRGGKQLKKAFSQFNTKDTVQWFESRGVKLKTEEDNRMFPVADNSQTIIDCLMREADKLGVVIQKMIAITEIRKIENDFILLTNGKAPSTARRVTADKIIIASGGSPKIEGFNWLKQLGHTIVPPVPSLFTFNMPNESIKKLMGVVANPVSIKIKGVGTQNSASLRSEGALLITHWGMSGPAVLKLSSWGARKLNAMNYKFDVLINWLGDKNEQQVRDWINAELKNIGKRQVGNKNPFLLTNRLWLYFLEKNEINAETTWNHLKKKNLNKLLNTLVNDCYKAEGKTTFKEEFVTCGGVSLEDVSFETMESKVCHGIYFAGEVLDIDAVTGGFNFQAAWTTGFIAGKLGRSPLK
ncbi:MAG: NAD(P)/FAD-dependent oxidoreductase [Bacteroidetes bacterium]|nr:MAG: NAD(P)/FAD-dependent oxidoreductase [Bacteroidota bacterium]